MSRSAGLALAALLAACGGDDGESDFTAEESQDVYATAQGQLTALHTESDLMGSMPESYDYDCPEGGGIAMAVTYEGGLITHIDHDFDGCGAGGLVLSGNMDYTDGDYELCDGAAYNVEGDLEVTGDLMGACTMDLRVECEELSGSTCGHEL